MIAGGGQALDLALATWRAPAFVEAARRRPLPEGMELLLRLAGGDADLAERGARASGETPEVVVEAAAFFLQQVLFAPDADSYRVLGVAPDAPDARIKQHYRLLVRWLHPDRHGADAWESLYADRVNRAWQDLRHPDKRAEYDRQRAAQAWETETDYVAPPMPAPSLRFAWEEAPVSGSSHRRLPALVLGGLALISALTLALMWYGRTPHPPRPAARIAAAAPPLGSDPVGSDPGFALAATVEKPGSDPGGSDPMADPMDPGASRPMEPTAPTPLNEADAHAVLSAFVAAYSAGDLPALMALFTRDARNNRGGIEAIAFDYQSLFERTEQRAIELEPTAWISHGEHGTVLARYRAEVRAPDQRRPSRSEGEIRFDLRRVGSGIRITQVRHGVD